MGSEMCIRDRIIIALVILILFGGRKIPELMRGLGSGIKEFKKATKDDQLKSDDNKINEPKK